MYEFSATVTDDYAIEITTNTYWNCKLEGNFQLSEYDGSGDTTVDIEIPDDVRIADGIIYFSFGDERCFHPELYINLDNKCYIETYPNYNVCNNEEKTVFFFYEEPLEPFYISISCLYKWKVGSSDFTYIKSDKEVMIISNGNDGELQIVPDEQDNCDGKNIIHVKLKKKADS